MTRGFSGRTDPVHLPSAAAVLLGTLGLALGFPNSWISCPPLVLLWPLSLAFLSLRAATGRDAFRNGWLTAFPGSFLALYWLALPIRDVGGLPLWGAVGCAVAVSACLAVQGGLFTMILWSFRTLSPLFLAVFGALLWGVLEEAVAVVTGFPWLPLTGALVVLPVTVQTVSLFGIYGTGSLWVLCVYLVFLPLVREPGSVSRGMRLPLLLAVLVSAGLAGFGILRLAEPPETDPRGPGSFPVLFVEGNVDQNQKWIPSLQQKTVARYVELTRQGLREWFSGSSEHPVILWSETCMPFFFERSRTLAGPVRTLVKECGSALLLGAPAMDTTPPAAGNDPAVYNRAILLGPSGGTIGTYDKEHLVPFGEYTPSFLHFSFLDPLLQGVGIYTEGQNSGPLVYQDMRAGMLICYEGIFPWLAQRRVAEGANILIDISNDSWFQRTPASTQHLYLTCLRAIEQNRWILRATNSGISAVIDPLGRIIVRGGLFHEGSFPARTRVTATPSLFHATFWFQLTLFPCLCIGLAAYGQRQKRTRQT